MHAIATPPTVDPDRELVLRAKQGDPDALAAIWQAAIPIARRRAELTVLRYAWLDAGDIESELLAIIPQMIKQFNPDNAAGNKWRKYLYFSCVWRVKDVLRGEDPLGISYPQKKKYPEWHRLGDEAFSSYEITGRESEPIDELIALEDAAAISELASDPAIVELDTCIEQLTWLLSSITTCTKSGKWHKPRQLKPRNRPLSPRRIAKGSLRVFLRNKKITRHPRKRRKKTMEQQVAQTAPAIAPVEQPAAPKPSRDMAELARKGWIKRKKTAAKAKKSKPKATEPAASASRQLQLAAALIEACGGLSNAAKLIQQLSDLKK